MAAVTTQLAPTNDTDANFRLWGKAISDQMAAGGWVKTTDTGQIDWATVLKPASPNVMQGYEIWRSNDASGSIVQMYLKIEYGSSTSNGTQPAMHSTAGFGSNGTGTLTGTTTLRTQISVNASSTSTRNCNLAAGLGWVVMTLFTNDANSCMVFSIERTLSSSFAEQNEILFCYSGSGANIKSVVLNQTTGIYPVETSPNAQAIVNPTNAVQSGNAGFSLQFGQRGGLTNPSRNLFGTGAATLGAAQTIVLIESYGVSRSYIINALNPLFYSPQVIAGRFE